MFTFAVLLLATSGIAMAGEDHGRGDRGLGFHWSDHKTATAVAAPEIDPASIVAGLTLLCGGLVVLRGRRKK
jgi:LPXTG-motif cell wall-anchored protein